MANNGSSIYAVNKSLVTDGSLTSSFSSPSFESTDLKTIFIQAIWSSGSSLIGTMSISASSDNVTFTTIEGSGLVCDGASGSNGWNIPGIGYPYMRFDYVTTTGTAIVNVKVVAKYI